MRRLLVLVVGLVGACALESDSGCPEGFVADVGAGYANGYCRAAGYLERVEADVGIYGFVKTVEGGCGPGDSTCAVTYESDYTIQIYPLDDEPLSLDDCDDAEPDPIDSATAIPSALDDVDPAHVIQTDADGRFWTELSGGSYCISSRDALEGWRHARPVVLEDTLVNATFVFDHGAY